MSIPPRFLDEIRSRLSLSEVIGRRVRVTRAGREFKACCPFHNEKSPSFTINDDKQFYHCFGCGAHGDVINFVMQHDNLGFMEAVEMLSAQAGLQMPAPDPKAAEQSRREKSLHDVTEAAAQWFMSQLAEGPAADVREYLRGRGLDEEICARFRIGYAPADGQALGRHLKAQGFTEAQMIEAGVLKESQKGKGPYAFFRDRVMFPVMDRRGRVVAFGGRVLPEHMRPVTGEGFKPPKYINSSDTPLFDKGRMLYGEHLARQAAREGHTLIVTEGYMDVVACHKAGFKGAVAPMGTALTDNQILTLWSMMGEDGKTPVLCFDGDNAGRRAAARACTNVLPLLGPGKSVRFAFLPEGEDPDSLVRGQGPKALRAVLEASLSLFDFIWASHVAGRTFETPEERAGLNQALNNDVAAIADAEIQKYYRELIRERIAAAFFRPRHEPARQGAHGKAGAGQKNMQKPHMAQGLKLRAPARAPAAIAEKILLAGMLNHPEYFHVLEEEFGHMEMSDHGRESLRRKIVSILGGEEGLDAPALRSILEAQGYAQEIGDILNESVYVHAAFCRPEGSAPAAPAVEASFAEQWLAVRQRLYHRQQDQEIRQGWRSALENASAEEEERLLGMVRLKAAEDG